MATLLDYISETQRLLNDVGFRLYTHDDLVTYVNSARVQIVGEADCVHQPATVETTVGQRYYNYNSAVFVPSPGQVLGIGGILKIRSIGRVVASGAVPLFRRAWPWFNYYYIQNPLPVPGPPTRWSTLQQGEGGTIAVDPVPDDIYSLLIDPICFLVDLVDDNDPDSLPVPFTSAIKYYAAYLALLGAARYTDSESMLSHYKVHTRRALQLTTPEQLPMTYPGGQGARDIASKTLNTEVAPQGTR